MKKYFKLLDEYEDLNYQIHKNASKLPQKQFNNKLKKLRAVVEKLWEIRESGKITHQ